MRYDNKNPAELYPGTTWELLASDKYIRTGDTPLSTGGNNSVSILKENLPNTKLKIDTFSMTTEPHTHRYTTKSSDPYVDVGSGYHCWYSEKEVETQPSSPNTGSASPYTENLGSGTALNIQPEFITLKFWKRLT